MGKGGFRKEADSMMFNHNRSRHVQESWGNGKALPTFHSLEGSWGEMNKARPLSPQKNISRGSVQTAPDLRSKRELASTWSLLGASRVNSNSN